MSDSREDRNAIILKPGVSFQTWVQDLRGALGAKKLTGHIFHTEGLKPRIRPTPPTTDDPSEISLYEDKLEQWVYENDETVAILFGESTTRSGRT